MLNSALAPLDLLQPPGNRCEKLGGTDRSSMRINGQWRDTFEWRDGHAHEVEIEDYHSVAPVVASPGRRGRVTFPSTTLENSQWP